MILMPISTWSAFKTTVVTNKQLDLQYCETSDRYEVYAADIGIFVWTICLLKDGGSDVTDFETTYKTNANKRVSQNVSVQTSPPFGSKTVVIGGVTKNLYARFTGFQSAVIIGTNTINYTATYTWAKLIGIEVVNADAGDYADLEVYDTAAGTYSGYPNLKLNQFSYSLNIGPDFYQKMAQFDADLYVGMVVKITYHSVGIKTVGINLLLNEVK